MLNQNKLWVGLLIGIIIPIVGLLMLHQIYSLLEMKGAALQQGFTSNFRERTLAIVAIALNLIPLQAFRRRRRENSMRGIVIATGVLALVWLFKFGPTLL